MKEKGYISTIKNNSIKVTKNEKNSKTKQKIPIDKLLKTQQYKYIKKKTINKNSKDKRRYSTKNVAKKIL